MKPSAASRGGGVKLAVFALLAAAGVGCSPAAQSRDDLGGSRVGLVTHNGFTENGFTENGFTENGFTENGFTENGFTENGFTENGFTENGFTENGIHYNALSTRQILENDPNAI